MNNIHYLHWNAAEWWNAQWLRSKWVLRLFSFFELYQHEIVKYKSRSRPSYRYSAQYQCGMKARRYTDTCRSRQWVIPIIARTVCRIMTRASSYASKLWGKSGVVNQPGIYHLSLRLCCQIYYSSRMPMTTNTALVFSMALHRFGQRNRRCCHHSLSSTTIWRNNRNFRPRAIVHYGVISTA